MAFISASNDRRIADLIDQAQKYSNPTGHTPRPPSVSFQSRGAADDLLERAPPPPWFEPIEHPADREDRSDGHSTDVPIMDGEGEVPDPSDDEKSRIVASGIDALAYYAPFHYFRQNHWGIYIRDYGIAYLASRFLKRTLTRSDSWALRCAYWLLFEHEYFHFQTEVAATRYELLTGDLKAYEHYFHDKNATWLEESMANASALQKLKDHDDALLTVPDIECFKDFASDWMKSQPPGYRDFDKWYQPVSHMQGRHLWEREMRGRDMRGRAMPKGRAALTSRLHEISYQTRHQPPTVASNVLRPYESADYSKVPLIRVHDSRIPWLRSGRLFPKDFGMQVIVHTAEHSPPHIHVEFSDGKKSVRVEWRSLRPLSGERHLSGGEAKDLRKYLVKHANSIEEKVQKVFQKPYLQCAE